MKLEVKVHASPMEYPIVSVDGSHCSTLNLETGRSLLDHDLSSEGGTSHLQFRPLYWHLDRASCEWVFEAWLSVKSLIADCGGQLITGKDGQQVSILVASELVTYDPSLEQFTRTVGPSFRMVSLMVQPTDTTETERSLPLLPPPILTLSHLQQPFTYIYPIAVFQDPEDDSYLELLLVSSAPPHHLLLPGNHSDLQLLFVDDLRGLQGWTIPVGKEEQNITMEMVAKGTVDCVQCISQDHVFVVPLIIEEVGRRVGLTLSLEARISPTPALLYHGRRDSPANLLF